MFIVSLLYIIIIDGTSNGHNVFIIKGIIIKGENILNGIKHLCSNVNKDIPVEDDLRDLLEAARAFLQCKEAEAEEIINRILKEETNNNIKSSAQEILLSMLFWQERYSEIAKLTLLSHEKRNLLMSIMGFYNNPDCKIIENSQHSIIDKPNIMEGLPAITVKINGHDLNLLFDTGSMVTVLSSDIAKDYGINIDPGANTIEGQDATGKILNPTPAHIKSIKINGIEIQNKICLLLPSEMLEFGVDQQGKTRRIDGTLGWDIIKDFKWTIDLEKRKLIVEASEPNGKTKNMCCDFYPMVNVQYDNKNMVLGLDTGSNNTVFRKSMAPELKNLEKSTIEVYSAGGNIKEEGFIIPELDLYINRQYIRIKNASVREQLHNNTNNFILPGVIGSDIAKNKIITIDFPNRVFSIED